MIPFAIAERTLECYTPLEMDQETFQIMWGMSGGEAEHCFLRIPQVENYCEARKGFNALEVMPNVSSFTYLLIEWHA